MNYYEEGYQFSILDKSAIFLDLSKDFSMQSVCCSHRPVAEE